MRPTTRRKAPPPNWTASTPGAGKGRAVQFDGERLSAILQQHKPARCPRLMRATKTACAPPTSRAASG